MRWRLRAASAIEPLIDGYTVNAWASWSAVSDSATAIDTGWISSLARGADDDAADDDAGAGAAEQLHEAVADALHLRARVAGERERDGLGEDLARVDGLLDQPTVAISGAVKTLEETLFRSRGVTASPRKCHIAIRPCIAATEASISTPVQSPAA